MCIKCTVRCYEYPVWMFVLIFTLELKVYLTEYSDIKSATIMNRTLHNKKTFFKINIDIYKSS